MQQKVKDGGCALQIPGSPLPCHPLHSPMPPCQGMFAKAVGQEWVRGGTSCSSCHTNQTRGTILHVFDVGTEAPAPFPPVSLQPASREPSITMAVPRSMAGTVIDAWWVLALRVSNGDVCPGWGRVLLPLPQAHTRWHCWCLQRDGELLPEKQSLQHPSI